MNWELCHQTIEKRIQDNWAPTPLCPPLWDNVKGEPPANGAWCRPTIIQGTAEKIGLEKRYRHPGVLVVQFFVPIAKGTRDLVKLIDQMATLFRSVTVNGIIFRTPSPVRVGDTKDGWFQMNLITPFRWDETF